MKTPGPDHPITIEPSEERVRVLFNGRVVAETTRSLVLREADYAAVHYIPREDANMTLLQRTAHATGCPYKGEAGYYSIVAGERVAGNAVWTYEAPYPAMSAIKDHLAFYPHKVDAIEIGEPEVPA